MARITVEDCLTKENNRFSLVQLAAKRAKQLLHGAKARILDSKNKSVVTALREIAAGEVRFMTEAEKVEARERLERERQERMAHVEQARVVKTPGDDLFIQRPAGGDKEKSEEEETTPPSLNGDSSLV